MSKKYCLVAACLSVFVGYFMGAQYAPVVGEEEGSKDGAPPSDVAEAYLKLSEPGPEHEKLNMRVGKWKVVATLYMAPGAPPLTEEASSTVQAIMGGRYLQENYSGEFMGREFTGLGISGYDNGLKKYVSLWIDSMSTGLMCREGTANAGLDVVTYVGEYFDPLRQATVKNKSVLTIKSKASHVLVMSEVGKDGSERKIMELVYTRVPQ